MDNSDVEFQGPLLQEFLQPERLGVSPRIEGEEDLYQAIRKVSKGLPVFPTPSCYLDEHWDFESIVADAGQRSGHQFHGTRLVSFADQILRAAYDLENALQHRHSQLSGTAIANFWQSWQVLLHIADFCGNELFSLPGEELKRLASSGLHDQIINGIEDARRCIHQQVSAYGYQIRSPGTILDQSRYQRIDKRIDKPGVLEQPSRPKPGPRPRTEEHQKLARIVEPPQAEGAREGGRYPRSISAPKAAKKVRDFGDERGLTQESLAKRLGISDRTLRDFLKSGRIGRNQLSDLAQKMNTDLEDLLK